MPGMMKKPMYAKKGMKKTKAMYATKGKKKVAPMPKKK